MRLKNASFKPDSAIEVDKIHSVQNLLLLDCYYFRFDIYGTKFAAILPAYIFIGNDNRFNFFQI